MVEAESAEFHDQQKKPSELQKKAYKARTTRYRAGEEVECAEEILKAVSLNDLGETIERAALIKIVQEEVRSAQTQF